MKDRSQLKEWREKSREDLLTEVKNLKEELFKLRLRKVTDVVENPALIRELKKDIARVKTILKEKEFVFKDAQAKEKKQEEGKT